MAHRGARGIECGQVNNGLECRAGLPFSLSHAVELTDRVIAPSDHREDRSAANVDREQRTLEPLVARFAAEARMLFLEPLQIGLHALGPRLLHLRIKRGVNLEPGQVAVEARDTLDLREDVVGEMRRATQAWRA